VEFNLADLWERVVDTVPDREAMVCGDRRLSFAEADERANRLAHVLAERGVGPGDMVALLLYNSTEYLEGMLAAFKLRAVPINVNYRYVEEELHYLLSDSGSKAIVCHRELAPRVAAVASDLPELATALVVDDASDASLDGLDPLHYEEALAGASGGRDFGPRTADDLYILYTGGTTGMPKGVMWRAEDVFFGAFGGGALGGDPITTPEEIAEKCVGAPTRCLPACPFMHGTAHWIAFSALYNGGCIVIATERKFDPAAMWHLIEREKVNFLVIVGDAFARPLVEALAELGDAVDISSLGVILSGGAILSPSVKEHLAEHVPGTLILDGYGASETGGQGQFITVKGGDVPDRPRFHMNADTIVLTEDLQPAAVGEVGKLGRRGHIPLGYHGDPENTEATFPEVDGVRWSVPGDFARLEEDGTITLLGRGSVSISTGGEKVFPEEVESALKSHPAVFDAVVVGVPDDRWGERVVAVVQPRAGVTPTLDDLAAHAHQHLAGYKVPRDLVLVDAITRSPSGKPDYRWAKERAQAKI